MRMHKELLHMAWLPLVSLYSRTIPQVEMFVCLSLLTQDKRYVTSKKTLMHTIFQPSLMTGFMLLVSSFSLFCDTFINFEVPYG